MKQSLNPTLRTVIVLAAIAFATPALADAQITLCHDVAASDSKKAQVQCDLRAAEDVTVKSVKVTGDGRSSDATYKPNSAAEPPISVLILLDQSVGRVEFNRLRSVAAQTVGANIKGVSFGAYGFTRDLSPIAPLGTSPATIKLALDSVSNKQGTTPELLRNIVEVLPLLTAAPGDQKVLLVLSNGNVEDTAYTVGEVSAKLKQANIVVIGVAQGVTPDSQSLRRLAQDTFGEFLTVPNGAAQKLKNYLSYGGSILFEPIASEMKIDADIQSGKPVSATFKTALTPVPETASPTKSEPISIFSPKSLYDAFLTWLRSGLRNQLILAGGVLAVVVVLLLLAKFAFGWRRGPETVRPSEMGVDRAESLAEIRPVLGWLEFLDGNQTREPIRSHATRIGRSSDNDIVLKNTSVHRQHAIIRDDPSGGFVIVDMDTQNGVKVNGDLVKSAKLKQGDVIELGEVRMRFNQPHSN